MVDLFGPQPQNNNRPSEATESRPSYEEPKREVTQSQGDRALPDWLRQKK